MDIEELRKKMNEIDQQMAELFEERMKTSIEIVTYKREHHLHVRDTAREAEVLRLAAEAVSPEYRSGVQRLFALMMAMSRETQEQKIGEALV